MRYILARYLKSVFNGLDAKKGLMVQLCTPNAALMVNTRRVCWDLVMSERSKSITPRESVPVAMAITLY